MAANMYSMCICNPIRIAAHSNSCYPMLRIANTYSMCLCNRRINVNTDSMCLCNPIPATKGGVVRRQNAPVPSLPHMLSEQRKVVHELAEYYRIETESHGRWVVVVWCLCARMHACIWR